MDGLEYREGLNATLISGGNGTNVIPDECRIHVNYRFAPDKDIRQAKALMMGADAGAELNNGEHAATGGVFEGFGIEMKDESPSARPGLDDPLAQSLVGLVRERTGREPVAKLGWTDVARFAALGIPAVNLGAGDSHDPLAQSLVGLVRERTGREPVAKLGWTDVARFAALGIPAVNLGAGDSLLAHKHDEQVPESDLTLMAGILRDWLG